MLSIEIIIENSAPEIKYEYPNARESGLEYYYKSSGIAKVSVSDDYMKSSECKSENISVNRVTRVAAVSSLDGGYLVELDTDGIYQVKTTAANYLNHTASVNSSKMIVDTIPPQAEIKYFSDGIQVKPDDNNHCYKNMECRVSVMEQNLEEGESYLQVNQSKISVSKRTERYSNAPSL